jgi:carbon monoxide dehydrogenase subunit G
MKVAGDYRFDAQPQEVWEALLDPEVLAAIMPGCKKLELTGENQYAGVMDMKVGPVQGVFQGKVNLENLDPPNGYDLRLDGQGAPGFVKATAKVAITADGNGTNMIYEGDAQVGGRIASVGQRLLDSSSKAIIKQSLEGLNSQVAARSAAAAGEDVAAPEAPTQAEFAREVAKEVAKDLVPKPVLIGGILLIIVLILLFFLL